MSTKPSTTSTTTPVTADAVPTPAHEVTASAQSNRRAASEAKKATIAKAAPTVKATVKAKATTTKPSPTKKAPAAKATAEKVAPAKAPTKAPAKKAAAVTRVEPKLPTGYFIKWPNGSYDLAKRGADAEGSGPAWLVICTTHGTTTPAKQVGGTIEDGGADALGRKSGRLTWCTKCQAAESK